MDPHLQNSPYGSPVTICSRLGKYWLTFLSYILMDQEIGWTCLPCFIIFWQWKWEPVRVWNYIWKHGTKLSLGRIYVDTYLMLWHLHRVISPWLHIYETFIILSLMPPTKKTFKHNVMQSNMSQIRRLYRVICGARLIKHPQEEEIRFDNCFQCHFKVAPSKMAARASFG